MNTLVTRAISGAVYVAIFIFCILFSEKTYIGLIAIFAVIAIWEFSKLIKFKNYVPYLLLPFIIFFLKEFSDEKRSLLVLIFTLLCSVRLIYHIYSKNTTYPKAILDKFDLSIRYIILPFSFLILLPFFQGSYHPRVIIFIIVLIWVNDSFAYLTGRQFGKTKLFERVSPKKTIEGFVGGLLFAVITGGLLSYYYIDEFSLINGIIIAILVSVFGTYGDLVESKFKRQANVKDSGNIMPGHGGILDRLDSLFFLSPFVYLYINYLL